MASFILFSVTIASMLIVDCLARERGWNRSRWMVAAASIGPLAIPLVYVKEAVCAVWRMIKARSKP
jgi:hypothetical protein